MVVVDFIKGRSYWFWLTLWCAVLVMLVRGTLVLPQILGVEMWRVRLWVWNLPVQVAVLVPFVTFAAGAAVARRVQGPKLVLPLVATSIAVYVMLAWVGPVLEYQRRAASDRVDVAAIHPFGPQTPPGILAQKAYVQANPPATYSLAVEEPLQRAPNFLDLVLISAFVLALHATLNGYLGAVLARILDLGDPVGRSKKLWAAGIGSAVLFFAMYQPIDSAVRASPAVSGWFALAVPVGFGALIGAFRWVESMRRRETALREREAVLEDRKHGPARWLVDETIPGIALSGDVLTRPRHGRGPAMLHRDLDEQTTELVYGTYAEHLIKLDRVRRGESPSRPSPRSRSSRPA